MEKKKPKNENKKYQFKVGSSVRVFRLGDVVGIYIQSLINTCSRDGIDDHTTITYN